MLFPACSKAQTSPGRKSRGPEKQQQFLHSSVTSPNLKKRNFKKANFYISKPPNCEMGWNIDNSTWHLMGKASVLQLPFSSNSQCALVLTPTAEWGRPTPETAQSVLTAVKAPSCPRTTLCCLWVTSELAAEVGILLWLPESMTTEVTILGSFGAGVSLWLSLHSASHTHCMLYSFVSQGVVILIQPETCMITSGVI